MKITRYFQSCLLIEQGAARILIDPSGDEAIRMTEFGKLDAVLFTHEHADHFDSQLAQQLAANGAVIYANASTAKQMKAEPNVVSDGQEFEVGGIKIRALELPHCPMIDGSEGPQNTGYVIDGKLFHPGDGRNLEGLKVDVLAAPITGPDVSLRDAADFTKQVSAATVIPIHYDLIGTKPEIFERFSGFFSQPYKVTILGLGQSTEV